MFIVAGTRCKAYGFRCCIRLGLLWVGTFVLNFGGVKAYGLKVYTRTLARTLEKS